MVLGLAVQVQAQSSLTSGLVAYYPFTEDGKDQSGHGLDLTLNNVVFTAVGSLASDMRQAATFDGVSSYGIVNQTLIEEQANWSWSAWLYSPQAGPVNPSVQSMYMEGAPGGPCFSIDLLDGLLDIAAFNISTPGNWLGPEVPNVLTNGWNHLAVTLAGGGVDRGTLSIFFNGVMTDSAPFQTVNPGNPIMQHGTVGNGWGAGNPNFPSAPWKGSMADLRFYNRALSSAEVQQLYALRAAACTPRAATATATVTNGFVVAVNITDGGCAYTNAPAVAFEGGGGTGAQATAVVANGVVVGIIISDAGAGYTTPPEVFIAAPVGTANGLRFAAGTSSGPQFSQVLVPIQVDLFTRILTFQFSLHWDPTVATYVDVEQFGLPGLGAASFGTALTSSGTLTVSWDDPTGSGQSLGDGASLFAIRLNMIGNAGAASSVTIDGTPTTLQVANSDLTLVPAQTAPGLLSVALVPKVVIGGQVRYYPTNYPPSGPSDQAVAGVTVNLTGATNLNQATATDGSYSFPGLAAGVDYEISPAKGDDDPPANGVSTLGIALIRRQILDLAPLGSPYALLAADVNASGTVDTLDIALIRRLILALTNAFPAGLWRFVPADYLFPDPLNPWGAPSSRLYPDLMADVTGQDYVAIKLGDVNHSWVGPGAGPQVKLPSGTEPGLQSNPEISAVRFEARGQVVQPGQRVAVQVSVGGFTGGTSAQFSLGWDARVLRYADVGEFGVRGLGEDNFGAGLAESGRLTFSWDDPAGTGLEVADGGPVFTVYFDVIGPSGSVSAVAFGDSPTVREVTVDLVPRAFASWDGQVMVAGKRPAPSQGGHAVKGPFRISVPSVTGR